MWYNYYVYIRKELFAVANEAKTMELFRSFLREQGYYDDDGVQLRFQLRHLPENAV